ncbi:MAG: phage holin family protein [Burkholderiaceae bacterium]
MLRRILAPLLGTLKVRIELAGLELQDEIDHVIRAIAMAIGGALAVCIGLTLAAATIVVALWESHRLLALGGLAALFVLGGAGVLWQLTRLSRTRTPMFAETLAQLDQDRRRLTGERPPVSRPAADRRR